MHLCQCAAVQDEFAEADVGAAAAEAGELQVRTRLCHVRLHAHCAHLSAQPKHLIVKIPYTRHIYELHKNYEHDESSPF